MPHLAHCSLFPKAENLYDLRAAAAAAGFDAVEASVALCAADSSPMAGRASAAASGVPVIALFDNGVQPEQWATDDPEVRRSAAMRLCSLIRQARHVGAASVTIATGEPPTSRTEDRLALLADFLARLRFEAEAQAVSLALNLTPGGWIGSAGAAADLVDEINSPCVGWCLDAAITADDGGGRFETFPTWIESLGPRLLNIQVAASTGSPQPLSRTVERALRRNRYDGPVTWVVAKA